MAMGPVGVGELRVTDIQGLIMHHEQCFRLIHGVKNLYGSMKVLNQEYFKIKMLHSSNASCLIGAAMMMCG